MKTRPLTFWRYQKRNSALVKEYEDFVSARADLDYLVADLNMVGKFTQMAYNGVAGYTDLQIKIRRIGVNVSRLCVISRPIWCGSSTPSPKSRTIVVDLQTTYQFLIDGMEDMAIVTLQSTATVAQGMAEAAEQLAKEFDKEFERVEDAHDDTLKTKDFGEKTKE